MKKYDKNQPAVQPVDALNQNIIKSKIKSVLQDINEGLYDKERSIRLTLLSILAGESTFMLGEPGTAKSLIARRIADAFDEPSSEDEIKFFDYLMNQFSQPDEIFGPVSIQELKNDKYKRKTSNYLPKAQFAFLDEIWKANPAIQNALLTILNEKIFRNGGEIEKVPLIGFISASNELPQANCGLDAIFDRFLVRILEMPISDEDNFRKMISADKIEKINPKSRISVKDVADIQVGAETVELSDECYNVIQAVRKIVSEKNRENNRESGEKYMISDRRWKKIAHLMKVSAWCNGRFETDLMDATLMADCIWSTVNQEQESRDILKEAVECFGLESTIDFKDYEEEVNVFRKEIDDNFFEEDTYLTIKRTNRKTFEEMEFYILEDENGLECCISKETFSYPSGNYFYYFYSESQDKDEKIPISKVSFNWDNATVVVNDSSFKIQPCPKSMANKTLKATIDCFDKVALALKEKINDQIKDINQDMGSLISQFSNNLFANSDLYSKIVFEEQVNMKAKFKKLLINIDVYQSRYKKLLEK